MQPDPMDVVLARTQVDLFWLPAGTQIRSDAELLAVCDGSQRDLTNQVVRTSTRDDRIPALVDAIDAWHTGVSQWLVVPGQNLEALERTLPSRGYAPAFEGDAWTTAATRAWEEGDVSVVQVHDLDTLRDNIEATVLGFGSRPRPMDLDRELALCTGEAARTARFVAYTPTGALAGSANINRYDALSFGFLWAGATVPEFRGRGVYRALLGARGRWAAARGLTRIGLYANRKTSAPVVSRVGFERHGPMTYWKRT